MNDPLVVRRFQRLGQLPGDRERIDIPRATARRRGAAVCTAPRDDLGQRRAIDELHDQRHRAASFLDAVDLRDVWMVQGREDLRFAFEPGQPFRVRREGRGKDLDGDAALKPVVARLVHLAHPAGAKQRVDVVGADAGPGGERHGWDDMPDAGVEGAGRHGPRICGQPKRMGSNLPWNYKEGTRCRWAGPAGV